MLDGVETASIFLSNEWHSSPATSPTVWCLSSYKKIFSNFHIDRNESSDSNRAFKKYCTVGSHCLHCKQSLNRTKFFNIILSTFLAQTDKQYVPECSIAAKYSIFNASYLMLQLFLAIKDNFANFKTNFSYKQYMCWLKLSFLFMKTAKYFILSFIPILIPFIRLEMF